VDLWVGLVDLLGWSENNARERERERGRAVERSGTKK
jgi:hypothetical protein